jgi:hypothetical protein
VAHPELAPAVVQSDAPIPNPDPPNQSGAAVVHLHSPAVVADHATAGKNTYPPAARHGHADSDAAARHRDGHADSDAAACHRDGHTGPNTTARYGHTGPDTTARDSYAGFNAAARDSHTTGSTDRDNRAGFGRPVFRGHPQWLRDHDRPGASRAVPIWLT